MNLPTQDSATPLLFVYGTLRRGFRHPMARLLALSASYSGAGRLPGRLYRLGSYPGAILSHNPGEWVRGDLYAMKNPSKLLARIDRYEALDRGRRRQAEYQRVVTAIQRDDGTTSLAWVYRYRGPVHEAAGHRRFPASAATSAAAVSAFRGTCFQPSDFFEPEAKVFTLWRIV